MKSKDSLSVYNRPPAKPTLQEKINLERTSLLYPENKPVFTVATNVPLKGAWDNGRLI